MTRNRVMAGDIGVNNFSSSVMEMSRVAPLKNRILEYTRSNIELRPKIVIILSKVTNHVRTIRARNHALRLDNSDCLHLIQNPRVKNNPNMEYAKEK